MTRAEVYEAIRKYIRPLFDASSSIAIVVAPPHKVNSVAKGLQELGMDVEKLKYGELPASSNDKPEDCVGPNRFRKLCNLAFRLT